MATVRWTRQRTFIASRSLLPVAAAIATLFTAMQVAAAGTGDRYRIDPAHSIPQFEFTHLGMTTQTGRFDKAGGFVVLNMAKHSGSVYYEVDTNSLNMGFGTESENSPGYQLFRVKIFPKIIFRSNQLVFDSDNQVIAAKGRLTMLGVSRDLTVDVRDFKCSVHPLLKKEVCAGEISAVIQRSQFGMVKFIPGISDRIAITIPVEAYKE
jgi:polyisoprenoid-binding protein YceI